MSVEANPAFQQNNTYSAEITRRSTMGVFLQRGATIGSVSGGLVGAGDLAVTYGGSGLGVSVAAGEVIVPGSSSTTQSGYYLRNTAALSLSPASANPSNPRIDMVAAEITDSAYSGATSNGSIAIISGTPTSGATLANLSGAPALPTSSLALAYILIPANASTISNTDIANVATEVILGLNSASPISTVQAYVGGGVSAGSYYARADGNLIAFTSTSLVGIQGYLVFVQSDWGNSTSKVYLRVSTLCNATGAGQMISAGLYPVTAAAGTTGNLSMSLGSVVVSATVTPTANSQETAIGSATVPSNNLPYLIAISVGGTTAAASAVILTAQLWVN